MRETEMPHIVLNLNRAKVREENPPIDFMEARRLKGPIYNVLIQELNEEGCTTAATYFQYLTDKEKQLFTNKSIRDRVQDDLTLLLKAFNYCKSAELAYRKQDCGGLTIAFHNIYYLIKLIEQQGVKFQWLLPDVYEIIMSIIRRIDPHLQKPEEIIARLYYMYGLRLANDDLERSRKYLRKALKLSRSQKWLAEFNDELVNDPCTLEESNETLGMKTLHEATANSLAEVSTKFAKTLPGEQKAVANEIAKGAMLLIAEVGIDSNKLEFYNAFIAYAEQLVDTANYKEALKLLNKLDLYLRAEDIQKYGRLYCKQFMIRGSCNASQQNMKQSRKDQIEALRLARQGNYRDLEADALVNLGMLYSKKKSEYNKGKSYYANARQIYLELGDRSNETKTHYLLAKLRADEMFPFFYDVLKYTGVNKCNVYKLRRWKNVCEPFWIGWSDYLNKVSIDPITCLLEQPDLEDQMRKSVRSAASFVKKSVNLTTAFAKQKTLDQQFVDLMEKRNSQKASNLNEWKNTGRYSTQGHQSISAEPPLDPQSKLVMELAAKKPHH